ncbi:hypothetical protein SDC9_121852 [bioreactor metagenome]|uniref:Uncharacterized protein n=1 Tax=bioreactor metagenome TaxID=1076179 RepID=A0A645CD80_9ZZZZ
MQYVSLQKQIGIIYKHEGNKETGGCGDERGKPSLDRIGFSDSGGRIGCQSHRRRDIRQHSEIKAEKMRRHHRDSHLGKRGSSQGRGDDILCRRRNPHPQYDRTDHRKYERKREDAVRKTKNERGKGQPHSRYGDDADDDAGTGAGGGYFYRSRTAGDQRRDDLLRSHAVIFITKPREYYDRDDRPEYGHRRRIAKR